MKQIQCAIYVRKSSDRGLDMEFNSLDNQEQACKAYIASQSFQGWVYAQTYSDAAISGGTMARPGLQQLLDDIRTGKINCVLVYKIDRLSRSIYDFKRMMKEDFEPHDCNLVSITQSFDTSTAMGKLTLNMLLSFAEFEREVASERVRDKMRATKAKGMWVGGVAPLGYDIRFGKLVPNEAEVSQVRTIYETYLESSGITECRDKLIEMGIYGKQWTTKKGDVRGGRPMTANTVEHVLKNQIYLGKLPNKSTGEVFDGLHPAIIDIALFDRVQQKLTEHNNHKGRPYTRGLPLLHQKIFTSDGKPFKNRKGNRGPKQYRYYKCGRTSLPAGDIERIITDAVWGFLNSDMVCLPHDKRLAFKPCEYSDELLKQMIGRIVYDGHKLSTFIKIGDIDYLRDFIRADYMNNTTASMDYYTTSDGQYAVIETPVYLSTGNCINYKHSTTEVELLTKTENATILIKALGFAWKYKKQYESGIGIKAIATAAQRDRRTIYKYLNLAYLSPRIINDIMNNKIPPHINLQTLFQIASKYEDFEEQERVFYSCDSSKPPIV